MEYISVQNRLLYKAAKIPLKIRCDGGALGYRRLNQNARSQARSGVIAAGRTRTGDPRIFSALLYQLSYRGGCVA